MARAIVFEKHTHKPRRPDAPHPDSDAYINTRTHRRTQTERTQRNNSRLLSSEVDNATPVPPPRATELSALPTPLALLLLPKPPPQTCSAHNRDSTTKYRTSSVRVKKGKVVENSGRIACRNRPAALKQNLVRTICHGTLQTRCDLVLQNG